jgi:hypothetical protein
LNKQAVTFCVRPVYSFEEVFLNRPGLEDDYPKTGATMQIEGKMVPKYVPGKAMKDTVN